jgi:hypothetical protein
LPGAGLFLPEDEADFVREAAAEIEARTSPNAYVAIFPDPGFLLFVTGRRSPFIDDVFTPGSQDATAEAAMIRRLHERNVEAVLITNRSFGEYGSYTYGSGLLDNFFRVVRDEYVPVKRLGGPRVQPLPMRRASAGLLLMRRDRAQPQVP